MTIKNMPSIPRQAVNFAKAMGRVASTVVSGGLVKVSLEERARRYGICMGCSCLRGQRCSRCGCFISLKLVLATEKCPDGKW